MANNKLAGRILNPTIAAMAVSYRGMLAPLSEASPYLAQLVESTRVRYTRLRGRFGYEEAKGVIFALTRCGAPERVQQRGDLDRWPEFLWDVAQCLREDYVPGLRTRCLSGLAYFYRHLCKTGEITAASAEGYDASPFSNGRRGTLVKFLKEEFSSTEETFVFTYTGDRTPLLMSLPFRSEFLRDLCVRSYHKYIRYLNGNAGVRLLKDAEDWFEGPIMGYEDMNGKAIAVAISRIRERYRGDAKTCRAALHLLFTIYRKAVIEQPERDFFGDSVFWNSKLLLDGKLESDLLNGYEIVPVGTYHDHPAYEKVLFAIRGAHAYSANHLRFGIKSVDFSMVKTELYRKILVNYGATKYLCNITKSAAFFCWLEQFKRRPASLHRDKDTVYRDELLAYRRSVAVQRISPATKNVMMAAARNVIVWASSLGLIRCEDNVFEDFKPFIFKYVRNPQEISRQEAERLYSTLVRLGQTRPRERLAAYALKIQLISPSRAGEICSIDISRLTITENGDGFYRTRQKNGGDSPVQVYLTKPVVDIILEVSEITEGIRKACPADGPKTNLFLYDPAAINGSGAGGRKDFAVLNIGSYNGAIQAACRAAGMRKLSSGNIRDTYMNAVARYARKKGLTDLQKATLTQHASRLSINSYVSVNVSEFLQASKGVRIGGASVKEEKKEVTR